MHINQVQKLTKLTKRNIKISSSGIIKTAYHNDSFLFLFGKRKLQSLEISCE